MGTVRMTTKQLKTLIREEVSKPSDVKTSDAKVKEELMKLMDDVEYAGSETIDVALNALKARTEQPDLVDCDLGLFLQYVEDGAWLSLESEDDEDDEDDDDSYEGRADPSQFFEDAQNELDEIFGCD